MANNVEGGLSGMRDRSRREFLTGVAALGVTATVAHSSLLTEDAAHTAHRRLRSSMCGCSPTPTLAGMSRGRFGQNSRLTVVIA